MQIEYYDDVVKTEPISYFFPSLKTLEEIRKKPTYKEWETAHIKKEKEMCSNYKHSSSDVNLDISLDTEKQDSSLPYIENRLREIAYSFETKIRDAFKDPRPTTIGEAKEWLKSGNWRLETDLKDDTPYYGLNNYFMWGKKSPDTAKRDQLNSNMWDDWQDAKDTVTIVTDEKTRLQTLKEFEAKSYT